MSSIEELHKAFAIIGAQLSPPIPPGDRRLDDLVRSFLRDRSLILAIGREGHIIGCILGLGNTLRILELEPSARGKGSGRALLHTFEVAALRLGRCRINLGADEARGVISAGLDLPTFTDGRVDRDLFDSLEDLAIQADSLIDVPNVAALHGWRFMTPSTAHL